MRHPLPRRVAAASVLALALGLASCSDSTGSSVDAGSSSPTGEADSPNPSLAPGEEDDVPAGPITDYPEGEEPADHAGENGNDGQRGPGAPASTGAPVPAADFNGNIDDAYVEDSLAGAHTVLAQPEVARDMSQVLSGTALEDFDNQRLELEASGLHMEGNPKVVSSREVDSPQPGTVVKEVCVDNSAVRTVDENGKEVATPAGQERSRMLLTYVEADGAWTLSKLSFPDDPNC